MRNEVLNALRDELSLSTRVRRFTVDFVRQEGGLWIVHVDLSQRGGDDFRLDESLEGADAWWPAEPRNGAAEVLCVVPEEQQLTLRFATTRPPVKGGTLHVYPPRYLEALMNIWERHVDADAAEEWFSEVSDDESFEEEFIPNVGHFTGKLRHMQEEAFELFGFRCGYLWGPPGTGKTFTIGVMAAQYLIDIPKSRILLMSTTNAATDQMLVAVDKALEIATRSEPVARDIRQTCKRIGNRFLGKYYADRKHLLPVSDQSLIERLVQLQARCPEKSSSAAYAGWKAEEDALRDQIRRQSMAALDSCRLAAMTTTRAAFGFDELREKDAYDLLIIDEASQVSTVHAITLATLAESTIFAGDPQQLAPIVQSNQDNTLRWLGSSMFDQVSRSSRRMCMLTEQSRMSPAICSVVSSCFYDGKLVVAEKERNDPLWQLERNVTRCTELPDQAVVVQEVPAESKYSPKYGGPIRFESAEQICHAIRSLRRAGSSEYMLVLTPFRSQRSMIRWRMQVNGVSGVPVRTVHSSQGMEFHTVIFDPCDGSSTFLRGDEAERIVNVGLSRAKARLVLFLSSGDRLNPLFDRVARSIETALRKRTSVPPLRELATKRGLLHAAVGQVVELDGRNYRITAVTQDEGRTQFHLQCEQSGKRKIASVAKR